MSYFQHRYASNSDIKELVARSEGRSKPENIEEIYDLGTEIHAGILEPHKLRPEVTSDEQKLLIKAMADRFWKEKLCRDVAMMPDFRREHEYYRVNRFGLKGVRCKVDGESQKIRTILELKGLSVSSEKAFQDSVRRLDYDQGTYFYINTASGHVKFERKLIVGMSKIDPDKLFMMLIDRTHPYYAYGKEKVENGVKLWRQFGFE